MACSKSEEAAPVAIDMTTKTYSADAKFRSLPVILQLNFESDGTVKLRAFPSEDVVTLKYEIGDKNAENTTLKISGKLDKTLYADGLVQGTSIDWNTTIARLPYNSEIVGFTINDYRFTSR